MKLRPLEKLNLIEKISYHLQNTMTTDSINIFLSEYVLISEKETVASSKRVYVKNILSGENDEIIINIARELDLYTKEIMIEFDNINKIDNKYIDNQIKKCNEKIYTEDFDGAITNARTLVESICIHILSNLNIKYSSDGNLIKLYRKVSEVLNMHPKLYDSESLIQITSGFFTIINGLSSLRNEYSDAHGKVKDSYNPQRRHAKLAVNSANTISDYLIESYLLITTSKKD